MESGMFNLYDNRKYSASMQSEEDYSEGSSTDQTSPEYDSKYSSNDDERWTSEQNAMSCKVESDEERQPIDNDNGNRVDGEVVIEGCVDIDSNDYELIYEFPQKSIAKNDEIIHVFTVDPNQALDEEGHVSQAPSWILVKDSEDIAECQINYTEEANSVADEVEMSSSETDSESDEKVDFCVDNIYKFIKPIVTQSGSVENKENMNSFPSDIIPPEKHVTPVYNSLDKEFLDNPLVNVEDFFVKAEKPNNSEMCTTDDLLLMSPIMDDTKRFFRPITPTTPSKSIKKSLSLPQSPSHFSKDDGRSSLCFEDLNIGDLSFNSTELETKMFDLLDFDDEIRTLNDDDVNSFLITEPKKCAPNLQVDEAKQMGGVLNHEDDLIQQEMYIENTVKDDVVQSTPTLLPQRSATHLNETPNVIKQPADSILGFCVEKKAAEPCIIKIKNESKLEQDDYIDVESLTDATEFPVLEANNVSSLLEQFEATEKINKTHKTQIVESEGSSKNLVNGLRLQEAAAQLNKNKMRQILMPTTNTNCGAVQKPMQDHDYCSPNKRPSMHVRHIVPKRRQSLLKPEVVTSNHIIKNSRHRSCKTKKVVYTLSSDDEDKTDKHNEKKNLKHCPILCKKKLSPEYNSNTQSLQPKRSEIDSGHVISSASDSNISCKNSPCSSGSIKLTIKNKTKVILNLSNENSKINEYSKKKETVLQVQENHVKEDKSTMLPSQEISLLKSHNMIKNDIITQPIKQNNRKNEIVLKVENHLKEEKSTIPKSTNIMGNDLIPRQVKHNKKKNETIVKAENRLKKDKCTIQPSNEMSLLKKHSKTENTLIAQEIKQDTTTIKRENPTQSTFLRTNTQTNQLNVIKKELKPKYQPAFKVEMTKNTIVKNEIMQLPQTAVLKPVKNIETPMPNYYRNRDPLGLFSEIEAQSKETLQSTVESSVAINTTNDAIEHTIEPTPEVKQPPKKKLNLLEYKMRMEGNSNEGSRNVSPEVSSIASQDIFYINTNVGKTTSTPPQISPTIQSTPSSANTSTRSSPKDESDGSKVFDPIREASRKILKVQDLKKQKAEASRKRDEDIIMSKIPKVENLELKPLISDSAILEYVNLAKELEKTFCTPAPQKPSVSSPYYEEIIKVSIGVNTDSLQKTVPAKKDKIKSGINFTIRKPDQSLLKQNVFAVKKSDSYWKQHSQSTSPHQEIKSEYKTVGDRSTSSKDNKIDKERFKGIKATLKSVKSNTDVKISSNSLFTAIQDAVMKKAPEIPNIKNKETRKRARSEEEEPIKWTCKKIKTMIINECGSDEHGEDKTISHLPKIRVKPEMSSIMVQTDPEEMSVSEAADIDVISDIKVESNSGSVMQPRNKRVIEDMSKNVEPTYQKSVSKTFANQRSSSRDRETKAKRSRDTRFSRNSYSRSKSRSRNRSRSQDRSHRYTSNRRRSRSPYRNRSRSPQYRRSDRSSTSYRRSERSYRSRSPSSRSNNKYSRTPEKKVRTPETTVQHKTVKTPEPIREASSSRLKPSAKPGPVRTKTLSESSHSSSSSSTSSSSRSTSSSSSSSSSNWSHYTPSPARSREHYARNVSEDSECIPPVEERRIVFVGKLETDITKAALRTTFSRFGPIIEVKLHSKNDGSRYGFVTYRHGRDAWRAVESARTSLARYDVGFGGRRAFCRTRYSDLDGPEAEYYREAPAPHPAQDISFELLLQETKNKMSQLKTKKQETV